MQKLQKMQKKACVITFGCQQNEADSEKIKGLLNGMGYDIIDADMTADMSGARGKFADKSGLSECSVIIMNTCAVREHAELKAFSRTGHLKHYKKKNKDLLIGICGCMVEQEHITEYIEKSFPYVDFTFGTREIHRVPEIINQVITGGKRLVKRESHAEYGGIEIENIDGAGIPEPEDLPVLRSSGFQAKVSIMYGCDNFCSYCIVPYVRGRERSRSKAQIIAEVRGLIETGGYKDITLLGQNVNSYKDPADEGYRFTDLLDDLVKIEGTDGSGGDYLLRFLTSHPKDVPAELIAIMGESKRLAKHFHLPVQAGSDRILELMNRGYTRDYYLRLIGELKERVPDIAITSDIIVGFPGETEREFEETLELVALAEFDNIFPFIYSKRKGTPAEEMPDDVPRKEKTERFARLIKLQNEIVLKKNKAYEGMTVRVLVESEYKNMGDKTKNKDKYKMGENADWLAGRTSQYKLVAFEGNKDLIGHFVNVKISEGKLHGLYGEVVL